MTREDEDRIVRKAWGLLHIFVLMVMCIRVLIWCWR
jgi:hypothetical protein